MALTNLGMIFLKPGTRNKDGGTCLKAEGCTLQSELKLQEDRLWLNIGRNFLMIRVVH